MSAASTGPGAVRTVDDAFPGASLPDTSLVICSRNRPELLLDAVKSLLSGDAVPAELIVIDQSDAAHGEIARLTTDRPCAIRYIWTQTVGLSRANNLGIEAARHDVLVFTHDDILAPRTWFAELVRALIEAGPRSVVTGRVLPTPAEVPGGHVPTLKTDERGRTYRGRIGEDVLFPLNMAMYRSAVEAIGPFDERLGPGTPFPAAEDNDFGYRLLEAGYSIAYVPAATLHHRAWRGDADFLSIRWRYGRGQGAFFAKHLSLRDPYMLRRMLGSAKHYLARSLRRLRREPRLAIGDILHALGMTSGAINWLLAERRIR